MPLYVGDYLADTVHLDGMASGAYLHLLMAMWRAGGKLPADDKKLARLTKLTPDQWKRVRDDVTAFFTRRGGSITHKRLSKELAKYHDKTVRLSEAGKRGQSEKRKKNNEQRVSQASATLKQLEPEPEPEGRNKEVSSFIGGSKNERGRADLRRTTTDARRAAWAEAIAERHRCEAGDQTDDSGGPGCADLDGSRGLRLAHAREA
jgi:uncharacterized protein YdaU (DUF1376 family)